jgi:hypothetical protein
MGWCSGTVAFDSVLDALLAEKKPSLEETIRSLVVTLEDMDWDCQQDSEYWSHPVVRSVMKKLHPDWDFGD